MLPSETLLLLLPPLLYSSHYRVLPCLERSSPACTSYPLPSCADTQPVTSSSAYTSRCLSLLSLDPSVFGHITLQPATESVKHLPTPAVSSRRPLPLPILQLETRFVRLTLDPLTNPNICAASLKFSRHVPNNLQKDHYIEDIDFPLRLLARISQTRSLHILFGAGTFCITIEEGGETVTRITTPTIRPTFSIIASARQNPPRARVEGRVQPITGWQTRSL